MSVRMKDIAHTLGISQTTVSHVLRGRLGEFRLAAKPGGNRHVVLPPRLIVREGGRT